MLISKFMVMLSSVPPAAVGVRSKRPPPFRHGHGAIDDLDRQRFAQVGVDDPLVLVERRFRRTACKPARSRVLQFNSHLWPRPCCAVDDAGAVACWGYYDSGERMVGAP